MLSIGSLYNDRSLNYYILYDSYYSIPTVLPGLMTYFDTRRCTYIGAFLTFGCQYHCPYCINRHGTLKGRKSMMARDWVRGLSRIPTRPDLPITLQGGEPTIHPGFYEIVSHLAGRKYMDLLTNFNIDIREWESKTHPDWFKRPSPYPTIRVSYHPGQSSILGLFLRVYRASRRGYPIGIWGVDHPAHRIRTRGLQFLATTLGITFRKKEFLGWYDHSLYGEYRYEKAIYQKETSTVNCRSNEILIAPDGYIHRCHADLYAGREAIGHILDAKLPEIGRNRPCSHMGACNECDVKLKTDRHQRQGFCSVEITPLDKGR